MNFSYKQKQDVFRNISTAIVLPKYKMVCTTLGTTKQGVVTHIESVEPFATRIKMKSRDQRANLY